MIRDEYDWERAEGLERQFHENNEAERQSRPETPPRVTYTEPDDSRCLMCRKMRALVGGFCRGCSEEMSRGPQR